MDKTLILIGANLLICIAWIWWMFRKEFKVWFKGKFPVYVLIAIYLGAFVFYATHHSSDETACTVNTRFCE